MAGAAGGIAGARCSRRKTDGARGLAASWSPPARSAPRMGPEMPAAGGHAADAAIGALPTLTVVEPVMVGIVWTGPGAGGRG